MSHAALQLKYWQNARLYCVDTRDVQACDAQLRFWAALLLHKGDFLPSTQKERYGYWERINGEEGGGLWFERHESGAIELVDYDGVSCLNQSIVDKLREKGYIVDESFDV